eukprot:1138662-Pelagomonas_calceolata.AAC.3
MGNMLVILMVEEGFIVLDSDHVSFISTATYTYWADMQRCGLCQSLQTHSLCISKSFFGGSPRLLNESTGIH